MSLSPVLIRKKQNLEIFLQNVRVEVRAKRPVHLKAVETALDVHAGEIGAALRINSESPLRLRRALTVFQQNMRSLGRRLLAREDLAAESDAFVQSFATQVEALQAAIAGRAASHAAPAVEAALAAFGDISGDVPKRG